MPVILWNVPSQPNQLGPCVVFSLHLKLIL
ncbi:hypothetical protein AZE42_09763 [Rhizopogon vesiculosus]|uniref:Uncharacterized protein n=1 Tax=Rhizopogon vesiculosus TaxID=180088 RepID=A0A1J8PJT9_9AGAM|nr:hypothetical protein AZE42_09763 [Rhizopogon vesiculosus]